MNVDESKCDRSRCTDRIKLTSHRSPIVFDDATEEVSKILRSSANVVGNWFLCVPVVSPHESTFIAESEFYETCIAYDDALKPFQFVNCDRTNTCFADCASPSRSADSGWSFSLDRERRLRITEQKKSGRPGDDVFSRSTNDFAGASVEPFRDR